MYVNGKGLIRTKCDGLISAQLEPSQRNDRNGMFVLKYTKYRKKRSNMPKFKRLSIIFVVVPITEHIYSYYRAHLQRYSDT